MISILTGKSIRKKEEKIAKCGIEDAKHLHKSTDCMLKEEGVILKKNGHYFG